MSKILDDNCIVRMKLDNWETIFPDPEVKMEQHIDPTATTTEVIL